MAHVTVPATEPAVTYTVTTAEDTFTIPAYLVFWTEADLRVFTEVAGVYTELASSVWSFTGSYDGGYAGGELLLATPVSNCNLHLFRSTEIGRSTDFPTGGPLDRDVLNTQVDQLAAQIVDGYYRDQRALRVADHLPALTAMDLSDRAGQMLVVNSDGTGIEFGTALTSIQATNPKTIVVLGSSNGAGVGASTYAADPVSPYTSEPATSWVGLLRAALGSTWTIYNRSITGSNTASSIARFWTDVAPYRPSHVILATALHNEGYDVQAFVRGQAELVRLCRLIGAIPIVRGPSAYNTSPATYYPRMLDARNQLDALGVLQIDALSTLDAGDGTFVSGSTYHAGDGLHCNDAGYAAIFSAIDLGMFQRSSQPAPLIRPPGTWKIDAAATLGDAMLINTTTGLAQALSSFTMRARVGGVSSSGATGRGFLSAYVSGISNAPLRIRNPFSVYDMSNLAVTITTSTVNPTNTTTPHDLVMVYKHTNNTAYFYIDGVLIGSGTLTGTPGPCSTFLFGSRITADGTSAAADYRFADCSIWATPLAVDQILAMSRSGRRPGAGLVFDGDFSTAPYGRIANLVQNGIQPTLGQTWAAVATM